MPCSCAYVGRKKKGVKRPYVVRSKPETSSEYSGALNARGKRYEPLRGGTPDLSVMHAMTARLIGSLIKLPAN
jgi:hypothetical protein